MRVLILTHGGLGEALRESAAMIAGGVADDVAAFGLLPGTEVEDVAEAVRASLDRDEGESVLLTDLPGASPARIAAELSLRPNVEAVSGVNLPMLLEVLLSQPRTAAEAAEIACRAGAEGIVDIGGQLRTRLGE